MRDYNNPSPVNLCRGPNGCGLDVLPNALGKLEHDARHLEWEATTVHGAGSRFARRMVAWRAYAEALVAECRRLREDVRDRDDIILDLEASLDLIHRQDAGLA